MSAIEQVGAKPARRKASKGVRRRQLIEATIDSIAERGFAATTMADVADGAGLSRGIVNFHFDSKEKLLAETLRHLSELYVTHWRCAHDDAEPNAAARLWAIVTSDFEHKVCNRRYIATWVGLRLESQYRPIYKRICGRTDKAFGETIAGLCRRLIDEGGYDADAKRIGAGIDAMLEGLWLHILVNPDRMSRTRARACAKDHLATLFPKHFTSQGPLPSARDNGH